MKIQTKLNKLVKDYKKKYKLLGQGRSRICFLYNDDWVVKIPLNEEGIDDQYYEEDTYLKHNQHGWYAKCYTEQIDGIPVLFMERVEPIGNLDASIPGWVSFIDCQQVGYTKDGRLVAYDFGFN